MSNNFFNKKNVLESHNVHTTMKEYTKGSSLLDILGEEAGDNFIVIAFLVNEVRLGRYEGGAFSFHDDFTIDERFIVEVRLFNKNQEIYARKIGNKYYVRVLTDGKDGDLVEVVDTKSNLFGDRDENADLPKGYARVIEDGRKIKMIVPVDELGKHYALMTRSYISFDSETGQAGFGYSRYLGICLADRGEKL